jgi:hypothetical protein
VSGVTVEGQALSPRVFDDLNPFMRAKSRGQNQRWMTPLLNPTRAAVTISVAPVAQHYAILEQYIQDRGPWHHHAGDAAQCRWALKLGLTVSSGPDELLEGRGD